MKVTRVYDYGEKVVVCFDDGHREGFAHEKRTEARAKVSETGWDDKVAGWWRMTKSGSWLLRSIDEGLKMASEDAAGDVSRKGRKGSQRGKK